ncbi:MAG: chemotaxis protein CheW, partial [Proteobacteria bacterium]|nr:chemotaxis protein CheW [Pseudomonadota bacterium]
EVTDDGTGMDPQMLRESAVAKGILSDKAAAALSDEEAVQLIFASGLSTSRAVSDVSGRGVGMDVVKTNVSRLHGTARVQTKLGLGSTVTIRLPLTLAISQALLVTSGKAVAALPLIYVVETTRISGDQVKTIQGHCVISHRGRVLPLLDLGRALEQMGGSVTRNGGLMRIVVVKSADQEVGLIVESLVGEQEIVLKPIGDALGDVPGLSGATILGDGTVALVLDVASLMDQAWLREASVTTPQAANSNGQPATYLENGA